MWNLKDDTNEPFLKQKQNHRHRGIDWWLPRRRGMGEGWIGILGLADANW